MLFDVVFEELSVAIIIKFIGNTLKRGDRFF